MRPVITRPHVTDGIALLSRSRRRFAVLSEASKNVSRPVSGQDPRDIGLVTAFALLDPPGAAIFRGHRQLPDLAQRDRRTVGFKQQLIAFAVLIRRAAGDAGNQPGRQASNLFARSSRYFG